MFKYFAISFHEESRSPFVFSSPKFVPDGVTRSAISESLIEFAYVQMRRFPDIQNLSFNVACFVAEGADHQAMDAQNSSFRFAFARLAAITSMLVGGAVVNAATIVNGSFENGLVPGVTKPAGSTDITGWIVLPTDIDWISGVAATPEILASDGSLYLDLNGLAAGGIQQTVATAIGQVYRVTFDMNANGNPGFRTRSLEVSAGADSASFSAVSGPIWTTYEFEFLATAASTDLSFVSLFTSGSPCGPAVDAICGGPMLDNVRIQDAAGIPEPATVSLTVFGIVLGCLRRFLQMRSQGAEIDRG